MLGDPRKTVNEETEQKKTRKFEIVKLEERIAPRGSKYHGGCHYNTNAGKYVGCGN